MENKVVKCLTTNTCNMHTAIHICTHTRLFSLRASAPSARVNKDDEREREKKNIAKNPMYGKIQDTLLHIFCQMDKLPDFEQLYICVIWRASWIVDENKAKKKPPKNSRSEKVVLTLWMPTEKKELTYTLHREKDTYTAKMEKQRQIRLAQMKRKPDKVLLLFGFHLDTQPTALDSANHFQITAEN